MATEDYTTYTEVDGSAYIAVTASLVTGDGDSDVDAYLYADKGVGHFGDFTHDFEFKNIGTGGGKWFPWVMANTLDDAGALKASNGFAIETKFKTNGYEMVLNSYFDGTKTGQKITGTNNALRYATIDRTSTTLTLSVYTDSGRTNHDTNSPLSLTGVATTTCRYIYGINNENKGQTGKAWNGTSGNLDLMEGGADTTLTADSGALTLTGAVASFTVTLVAAAGALALTGGTTSFQESVNLDAQPGALTFTGGTASLLADQSVVADPGALALTGGTASLTVGLSVAADPGTLVLTGGEATFLASQSVVAAPGALSFSGGIGSLNVSMGASGGALALTGGSAASEVAFGGIGGALALSGGGATFEFVLAASSGVLTLTGGSTDLATDGALNAAPGTLTLSGGTATFTQTLAAEPSMLTITGGDMTPAIGFNALGGRLTLTGGEADVSYEGAVTDIFQGNTVFGPIVMMLMMGSSRKIK